MYGRKVLTQRHGVGCFRPKTEVAAGVRGQEIWERSDVWTQVGSVGKEVARASPSHLLEHDMAW